MNPVTIIPTYISNPRRESDNANILGNYDHMTPLNEEGELDRCLKSLGNVDNPGLVIILVVAQKGIEELALEKVKRTAANNPQITTMVVGNVEVDLLKSRLEQLGAKDVANKVSLRGYGNIRNVGLILAQAFGFDAAIFLDDDEIVDDPDFFKKAVYGLGKLTPSGIPILVKSGYYVNQNGTYLSTWEDAWYNKFWQKGSAFNAWITKAMAGHRLTRSNHVCGGCLAIHKEAFSRMCFDPYIPRGEDLDYLLDLRMHGSDIWFDNKWVLRHLPPETKSEGKRFRQDTYRWLYEQAKIEFSWANIDLQKVTAATLMPYPGAMLGKGLKSRISLTARLRSFGRPDKKEYSRAAKAAKKDALEYAERNCTKYFEFERAWPEMMRTVDGDRVISSQILSMTSEIPRRDIDPGKTTEVQLNLG
jgi:glycosyltransferase involved in cell wall biosynthesis